MTAQLIVKHFCVKNAFRRAIMIAIDSVFFLVTTDGPKLFVDVAMNSL